MSTTVAASARTSLPWKWIAAGLGAILLGLLFAPWYDIDWSGAAGQAQNHVDAEGNEYRMGSYFVGDLNAWGTSGAVGLYVAVFSLTCILRALLLRAARPVVGWVLTVAAAAAVVAIAARMIWPPLDVLVPAWGAWASLGVAVAALLANGMDSIAGR